MDRTQTRLEMVADKLADRIQKVNTNSIPATEFIVLSDALCRVSELLLTIEEING